MELALAGVMTALQRPCMWDEAKRALAEPSFMDSLLQYNKDALSDSLLKKLARFTSDPHYTAEVVSPHFLMCPLPEAHDHICQIEMLKAGGRRLSACRGRRGVCACGCVRSACTAVLLVTLRLVVRGLPARRRRLEPSRRP